VTRIECANKYGAIVDWKWADESKHCVLVKVPEPFCKTVTNSMTGRPWQTIYCNRDMVRPLFRALSRVHESGRAFEIKTFDGCFNIRMVRGEKTLWSAHAWALACDFNALQNPLGRKGKWSDTLVKCFQAEGFAYGGNFSREDPMHLSYAGF